MKCSTCEKQMTNAIDSITGKVSKHLWKCKCTPGIIIAKG